MASPTTAITRLDLSLTYQELSTVANRRKYVGLQVLPPLSVEQEAADFPKIKIESLLGKVEDTKRAPRSEYNRDTWEWGTDSYKVDEHGVEEIIDDAEIERYGDVLRVEQLSAERAINRILGRLEYDIAAAVFNPNVWQGPGLTTALETPWTTKATANPVDDIDAAHDKVSLACGEDANTLLLTKKAFRALIRTDRLEGLLKYDAAAVLVAMNSGQNQNLVADVTSGLKELLQVEKIIVARGFTNTADKGQAASLARIWDDSKAMLCVTSSDGINGDLSSPSPCIGRTIFSDKNNEPIPGANDNGEGSLIMEEYREDSRRGSIVRPRNKRQVKILHKEAGHLLTNVTAG